MSIAKIKEYVVSAIVLDNNPNFRNEIQASLSALGIACKKNGSGKTGYHEIAKARERCDLIICDTSMQDIAANQFMSALRKNPRFNQTQVIITINPGQIDEIEGLLKYGISGYLVKPIITENFLTFLGQIFQLYCDSGQDEAIVHANTEGTYFEKCNQFESAHEKYLSISEAVENNSINEFALARTSFYLGDQASAVTKLLNILKKSPALKSQIGDFIKNNPIDQNISSNSPKMDHVSAIAQLGKSLENGGKGFYKSDRIKHILIASSSFEQRQTINDIVISMGIPKVTMTSSCAESMKLMEKSRVDIAIVDTKLDDANILQFADLVVRSPKIKNVKVLGFFDKKLINNLHKAFEVGMSGYCELPYSSDTVRQAIHDMLVIDDATNQSGNAQKRLKSALAQLNLGNPENSKKILDSLGSHIAADAVANLAKGMAEHEINGPEAAEQYYARASNIAPEISKSSDRIAVQIQKERKGKQQELDIKESARKLNEGEQLRSENNVKKMRDERDQLSEKVKAEEQTKRENLKELDKQKNKDRQIARQKAAKQEQVQQEKNRKIQAQEEARKDHAREKLKDEEESISETNKLNRVALAAQKKERVEKNAAQDETAREAEFAAKKAVRDEAAKIRKREDDDWEAFQAQKKITNDQPRHDQSRHDQSRKKRSGIPETEDPNYLEDDNVFSVNDTDSDKVAIKNDDLELEGGFTKNDGERKRKESDDDSYSTESEGKYGKTPPTEYEISSNSENSYGREQSDYDIEENNETYGKSPKRDYNIDSGSASRAKDENTYKISHGENDSNEDGEAYHSQDDSIFDVDDIDSVPNTKNKELGSGLQLNSMEIDSSTNEDSNGEASGGENSEARKSRNQKSNNPSSIDEYSEDDSLFDVDEGNGGSNPALSSDLKMKLKPNMTPNVEFPKDGGLDEAGEPKGERRELTFSSKREDQSGYQIASSEKSDTEKLSDQVVSWMSPEELRESVTSQEDIGQPSLDDENNQVNAAKDLANQARLFHGRISVNSNDKIESPADSEINEYQLKLGEAFSEMYSSGKIVDLDEKTAKKAQKLVKKANKAKEKAEKNPKKESTQKKFESSLLAVTDLFISNGVLDNMVETVSQSWTEESKKERNNSKSEHDSRIGAFIGEMQDSTRGKIIDLLETESPSNNKGKIIDDLFSETGAPTGQIKILDDELGGNGVIRVLEEIVNSGGGVKILEQTIQSGFTNLLLEATVNSGGSAFFIESLLQSQGALNILNDKSNLIDTSSEIKVLDDAASNTSGQIRTIDNAASNSGGEIRTIEDITNAGGGIKVLEDLISNGGGVKMIEEMIKDGFGNDLLKGFLNSPETSSILDEAIRGNKITKKEQQISDYTETVLSLDIEIRNLHKKFWDGKITFEKGLESNFASENRPENSDLLLDTKNGKKKKKPKPQTMEDRVEQSFKGDSHSLQAFKKIHRHLQKRGEKKLAEKFYNRHRKKYDLHDELRRSARSYKRDQKKRQRIERARDRKPRGIFKKAFTRNTYSELQSLAIAALKIEDFIKCRNYCRKMLRLDPKKGDGYNIIGVSYKKQGHIRRSIKEYERGISSDATCVKLYHNLAIAYANVGESQLSEAMYRQARRMDPKIKNPNRKSKAVSIKKNENEKREENESTDSQLQHSKIS